MTRFGRFIWMRIKIEKVTRVAGLCARSAECSHQLDLRKKVQKCRKKNIKI